MLFDLAIEGLLPGDQGSCELALRRTSLPWYVRHKVFLTELLAIATLNMRNSSWLMVCLHHGAQVYSSLVFT